MLDAACAVFGERGYVGATTDAIAEASGVSQAYVVRTFGSKEALFEEAAGRALGRVEAAFREALAKPAPPEVQERLGIAYVELLEDRGTLLTVMHLLTLGHHARFGPVARDGMLSVYRLLRLEAGLSVEDAIAFMAKGTLINALLGAQLERSSEAEADARVLLTSVFTSGRG